MAKVGSTYWGGARYIYGDGGYDPFDTLQPFYGRNYTITTDNKTTVTASQTTIDRREYSALLEVLEAARNTGILRGRADLNEALAVYDRVLEDR